MRRENFREGQNFSFPKTDPEISGGIENNAQEEKTNGGILRALGKNPALRKILSIGVLGGVLHSSLDNPAYADVPEENNHIEQVDSSDSKKQISIDTDQDTAVANADKLKSLSPEERKNHIENYWNVYSKIYDFLQEHQVRSWDDVLQMSSTDLEKIRQEFELQIGSQKIKQAVEESVSAGSALYGHGDVDPAFGTLIIESEFFNAQGVVFEQLQQKGLLSYKVKQDLVRNFGYFSTSAKDYLPHSSDVYPYEIDPRVYRMDSLKQGQDKSSIKYLARETENFQARPGWSDTEKMSAFLETIDNPKVRTAIIQDDMNLSEAYSFVKAFVNARNRDEAVLSGNNQKINDEELIHRLMFEKKEFENKEIIGPNTEEVILFNGFEKVNPKLFENEGKDFLEVAKIVAPQAQYRVINGYDDKAQEKLFESIYQTKDKNIVVNINTHGAPDSFMINDNNSMGLRSLARALIARLDDNRKADALKNVTFIFEQCHSYSFTLNFIRRLEHEYKNEELTVYNGNDQPRKTTMEKEIGINFEDLVLPTIITNANEGSFSYGDGFNTALEKFSGAIKKEGKIDGKFLMKRIQPILYLLEDMTFFTGHKGSVMEIGKNEESVNPEKEVRPV